MATFKIISYIVAAIWFAGVLRWDVFTDYRKWLLSIPVNHTREAAVRVLLLLPTFILLLWPKLSMDIWTWDSVIAGFIVTGLIFSVWWELFDGWYNKKRGFSWRFNGSVDEDDSILDKFLYRIGDTWEGILKLGLILTFLAVYIILK